MQQKTRPQGSSRRQNTGLFITTACALALVASMLVVFNVLQVNSNKNKNHVAGLHNTVSVIPTPPPLKTNVPDPGAYITILGPNDSMPLMKVGLKTHKVIWTHTMGNSSLTSPVAVGSVIYIASIEPAPGINLLVDAIDSKTGKTLWEFHTNSDRALATPTFADGVLYLENEAGRITALNANTGKQLWVQEVGSIDMVNGTAYGAQQLAVHNNVVYGSVHNILFALNAQTGKFIWHSNIDAEQIFTQPIVANDTIYLTSAHRSSHTSINYTAYAYAYHTQNGQRIWTQQLGNQYNTGNVTLHNNMLYIGAQKVLEDLSSAHTFMVLDASNGVIKWQNNIGSPFVTPLFENNVLYLQEAATYAQGVKQTPDVLHAYDAATGNELWHKNIDGISPFELHDGVIYSTGPSHELSALSTKDGSVIWQSVYAPKVLDKFKNDIGRVFSGTIEPLQ